MRLDRRQLLLYAVTDRSWCGAQTLCEQVEAALRGGATMVQLREKKLDDAAILGEALALRELCDRYGVPLIINDSVDIALRSGADGVHLGQGDGDVAAARQALGPDRILGVSAHSVEQALRAARAGADYLGAGAVFPTGTKTDAGALSLETLRDICAAAPIPVVAIGGVTREKLSRLSGSGAAGVAVVSAIFAARDIETETAALKAAAREALGL